MVQKPRTIVNLSTTDLEKTGKLAGLAMLSLFKPAQGLYFEQKKFKKPKHKQVSNKSLHAAKRWRSHRLEITKSLLLGYGCLLNDLQHLLLRKRFI
jgi:hypothetical protein